MRIFVINPGATSTKIAIFEEETAVFSKTITHDADALAPFSQVLDQVEYRLALIRQALEESGFCLQDLDAICARGGLLRHIPAGTYRITDRVLADIYHPPYGEHAANLGVVLADRLARPAGLPAFFVDPVSVDELSGLARISGCAGMERESFFHALNQKCAARKAAQQLGKPYAALQLIVAHLGGGVSVAAHDHGRVIDNYNVKDDGAMGMDRGGALPVGAVVKLCFSGLTQAEVQAKLGSGAGVFSYLGTRDLRLVERRAFQEADAQALQIFQALAYQLAKDIGAMAAVLRYQVDAIVYTGGMAHSDRLCREISSYVGPLAPVLRFPGEFEMQALAAGALRVLHGQPALDYCP